MTRVVYIVFLITVAGAFPRKHSTEESERRRVEVHSHTKHRHEPKHQSAKIKGMTHHDAGKKHAHKVYKKFGMFAAPSFAFADTSAAQGQQQQQMQQFFVPVSSASFMNTAQAAPQMVSTYTAAPSQRATLGTEVVGDQTHTQSGTAQTSQPQTVHYEGAQLGTNADNSVLKTTTQGATLQQDAGATPTELVGSPAGSLDPGSQGIQSFAQQDAGKGNDEMKDLQVYNGPLPDSGQKPQIAGVSPQEEVKIVNLGDDEKTASLQQEKSCGGCPPGAKCVSGQCQIQEEVARAQGLTGKGTPSNPGSLSDIHNLETQELSSLLNDASKADTPPGAVPESTTMSPAATEYPSHGQLQTQTIQSGPQLSEHGHQTAQFPKPAIQQVAQQPGTVAQPHFTSDQLKELRDFARMYKMYQFIRKMEERLNDPDCAPVCRKLCKNFCPAKCCHGQKVNTSVVSHLMQTADKMQETGTKVEPVAKKPKTDMSGMEDNGGDNELTEEQEEKKMDKGTAGKKHILIRIVKNDVLDKPRSEIEQMP